MSTIISTRESAPATQRLLLGAAWLAMLLLSRLPQIIAVEFFSWDGEIAWWWLGTGLLFVAITFVWPPLKPLRNFSLILAILASFIGVLDLAIQHSVIWQRWFGEDRTWALWFFGTRLPLVLLALALVPVLHLLGYRRDQYFLIRGKNSAPSALRLPGRQSGLPWLVAGPLVAVLLAAFFALALRQLFPPPPGAWAALPPLLPAIALLALTNGFGEEMAYRAAPVATLLPVVGGRHAIWIMAVWFGLGHFYGGVPSGLAGVIGPGFLAVLFGRALLATRSIVLPVSMHLFVDFAIYLFLAMAAMG